MHHAISKVKRGTLALPTLTSHHFQCRVRGASTGRAMIRVNFRGNPPKPASLRRPPALWTRLFGAMEDFLFWLRLATWNRFFDGFDREFGAETGGSVSLDQLGILQPAARYGVRYQPIDRGVFLRALRLVQSQIVPEEFTFVDLGCGKGRAMMLAAELPFREVVGIDISPSLVESARQNLERAQIANARVVCQNAANWQLPAGNLLVYLFNPFVGPVFRRVVRNLCVCSSADLWIIYVNPIEKSVLEGKACFVPWKSCATFAIYRHLCDPAIHGADGAKRT
jgi:SAM-dependent methyltransferase